MLKYIKNLFSVLRLSINNSLAIFRRRLGAAGVVGGALNINTELEIKHIRNGKVLKTRKVLDKCVTNAFVNHIVDALQGVSGPLGTIDDFKYHASGTGTANESATDTALGAEVQTRVAGTQVEGDTGNVYKSVATITYNSAVAVSEHGLFSADTGGTLMDRTKFPAINLVSDDSIQFTYTLTLQSGG